MYLTKHKIDYNWRFTELVHPDRLKTLKGHDDHVVISRFSDVGVVFVCGNVLLNVPL